MTVLMRGEARVGLAPGFATQSSIRDARSRTHSHSRNVEKGTPPKKEEKKKFECCFIFIFLLFF